MSVAKTLQRGRHALAHLPHPLREARTLLAHAAGIERDALHRLDDADLTDGLIDRFDALVGQRAGGRPLARILGYRDFHDHRFTITDDVLDPRADTEALVNAALRSPFNRVLDLGTGSGCILVSLLAARPGASGLGTDISPAALDVARRNARAIGVADRTEWRVSDWYESVAGRFDLIVSNPPYIAAKELAGLSPEVRDQDPEGALSDGADGLTAFRAITAGASRHIAPGGRIAVEIGWRQADAVRAIFAGAGLGDITCHPDLEGRDRVVTARFR